MVSDVFVGEPNSFKVISLIVSNVGASFNSSIVFVTCRFTGPKVM